MRAALNNILHRRTLRFIGPAPRATNDYATHVPVLIGLAKSRRITSVLEFGAGHYSTKIFLNRKTFPDLKLLHSYETDQSWQNVIKQIANEDSRVSLNLVNGPMSAAVDNIHLDDYDLIFVDDSHSAEERVRTIDALCARRPHLSLVVIHDYEVPGYIKASRPFRNRYSFKAFNPETGVVWENDENLRDTFKRIDRLMKRHARYLQPDNVADWLTVFEQRH